MAKEQIVGRGQNINYVDVRAQQDRIVTLPDETVDQLFNFGTALFSEVQSRSAQIDTKLGSYLGFCAAVIGFLSIGATSGGLPTAIKYAMLGSVVFTLVALGSAFWGLKTKLYLTPSESDWFSESLLADAKQLKQFHVISLLLCHQDNQTTTARKARVCSVTEKCLAMGALLAGMIIILRVL